MVEIKPIKSTYIEDYDITVKPYLTYAEIQAIVNSTVKLTSWAERQQNIDMLIMLYATDIGEEKLNELGHDVLYTSGVIDVVQEEIENVWRIYKALDYEESVMKTLAKLSVELPKIEEAAKQIKVKRDADSKKSV